MNTNNITNKIIIIGGNHHNTLGLIRSVGEKGLHLSVFLEPCNLKFCNLRFSKYITYFHLLETTEQIIDILREQYWDETQKPIIICGSDSSISFLDNHYDELKNHFFIFNANEEQGRINLMMDKLNTFPIAEKAGFSLIRTWHIVDNKSVPHDIKFPCIIKGNNSTKSEKTDIYICKNQEELTNNLHEGIEYIVQEFIEKDYELDIVGFSYNHGKDVVIPGAVRKIRDSILRQSGYIRLDPIDFYPNINVSSINRMLEEIGYEGIFSIEVLCKAGCTYFLEINLRNDGTGYLYSSTGINYPLCWILYCTGALEKTYTESLKIQNTHFLIQLDDLSNLKEGKIPIVKWCKQAISADCHFVLNHRDLKPFLYQMYVFTKQFTKKIFK